MANMALALLLLAGALLCVFDHFAGPGDAFGFQCCPEFSDPASGERVLFALSELGIEPSSGVSLRTLSAAALDTLGRWLDSDDEDLRRFAVKLAIPAISKNAIEPNDDVRSSLRVIEQHIELEKAKTELPHGDETLALAQWVVSLETGTPSERMRQLARVVKGDDDARRLIAIDALTAQYDSAAFGVLESAADEMSKAGLYEAEFRLRRAAERLTILDKLRALSVQEQLDLLMTYLDGLTPVKGGWGNREQVAWVIALIGRLLPNDVAEATLYRFLEDSSLAMEHRYLAQELLVTSGILLPQRRLLEMD